MRRQKAILYKIERILLQIVDSILLVAGHIMADPLSFYVHFVGSFDIPYGSLNDFRSQLDSPN